MEARCAMDRRTFTITVNPAAEADQPPSGSLQWRENTTAVTFTTTSTGGVTTYSWANDQPTIGLPATGNGDIPSFVATNPGTAPVVATIIVTTTSAMEARCAMDGKNIYDKQLILQEKSMCQRARLYVMEKIPRQLLLQQPVPEELQPIPG